MDHATICMDRIEADRFLTKIHIPSTHALLVASCIGQTIQAFIYGLAFAMVYSYFQGPRRDSRLARLGVVYLCFMSLAHIVLCNYQTARVITYFDRFAAVLFTDFWLFSLGTLIKLFITVPVLVFFSRRAYIIWNRSKVVLATCLLFDLIGLIGCSISISQGLKAPWGLGVVSNEEFYRWAPTLGEQVEKLRVMGNVAVSATFANVCVISVLITYGIYRHRNGFQEMDNAISKIVFICSESLVPVLLIVIVDVVGLSITGHPVAVLLSRAVMQLGPPIYLHGLVLSLVSRERVATILSAEPVRQMAPYASEGSSTYVTSSESRLKSRRRGRKRLALFGRHSAPTEAFRLGSRDRANDRARELATEEVGLSPISLLYNSVPGQQSVSLGRTVSTDGPKTPGPYSSVEYKPERLQQETLGADVSEKECSAGVGNNGEKGKEAGPEDEDDEQGSLYDFCDMLRGGPPDSARRRG